MQLPNDNRVILAIGAGVAILAAIVLALMFGGKKDQTEAPPVDRPAGLQVDLADAPSLEPTRELRCFVNGQFIGMATLADCARRNGLATDALDVGLDETGALAAAPTASFAPPPALPDATEMADSGFDDPYDNTLPKKPQPQPQPRVEQSNDNTRFRILADQNRNCQFPSLN